MYYMCMCVCLSVYLSVFCLSLHTYRERRGQKKRERNKKRKRKVGSDWKGHQMSTSGPAQAFVHMNLTHLGTHKRHKSISELLAENQAGIFGKSRSHVRGSRSAGSQSACLSGFLNTPWFPDPLEKPKPETRADSFHRVSLKQITPRVDLCWEEALASHQETGKQACFKYRFRSIAEPWVQFPAPYTISNI